MSKNFILSAVSALLTVIFIILVCVVDVAPVGPAGTSVGFSSLNSAFHSFTGENEDVYEITEIFGYLSFAVVAIFGLMGFCQLVKNRSFLAVDNALYCLGSLYFSILFIYFFFERIVINYRPIIEEGSDFPEPSFPSSHTVLIVVVMGSAMIILRKYIKSGKIRSILYIIGAVSITVTVVGRLMSGVHWLTDIVGGILISTTLLLIFNGVVEKIKAIEK